MEISEIKAKLSITIVLAHYGITHIRNKQIRCLFHEDKTPSMQVYEDKGLVYCHSSNCKNGGKHLDQIEIIQQKENLSKHEAIKKAISLITNEITVIPIKMIPMEGLYHNTNNETQTIVITESIIDSATIQIHTAFETLAMFGTNGYNQEHEILLKSLIQLTRNYLFFRWR
jgi:uncharacterized paraquat-inducible protein A